MPKIQVLAFNLAAAFVLLWTPAPARCQASAEPPLPVFETESVIAVGGSVGLAIFDTYEEPTTQLASYFFAQRFRLPRYSPFGLELNMTMPSATFGAGLLIEAVNTRYVRVHILELGLSVYHMKALSVARIKRSYDLTIGCGFDLRFWDGPRLAVEWRAYLPDPVNTIARMADFARPVYEEALKGGMLWIGVAQPW